MSNTYQLGVVITILGLASACGGGSNTSDAASGDAAVVDAATAKDLASFRILSANNPGLTTDVTAKIEGAKITANVPFGTPMTALKATFQTTGTSVTVGDVAQSSGVTANDFTSVVIYTVTAADSSTKSYTVILTAAPSFGAHVDLATATTPGPVAIGDFNGDGKPDLAVANVMSDTVSVFLDTTTTGASTPTFTSNTDLSTISRPYAVAVSDFNGDGKPDLAVTNINSSTVSILLNTTATNALTPTFAGKVDFALDDAAIAVAVGDFNGDGKPDLALALQDLGAVTVLLDTTATNATTPTFAAKVDFTTGLYATAVAVGDLNGDGRPDVASTYNVLATHSPGAVSVLLDSTATNAATPTFAAKVDLAAEVAAQSVAIADFNADGIPDVVVANAEANTLSMYVNESPTGAMTPNFAPGIDVATDLNPFTVAVGDFNGDGKPDLVCGTTSVSVFLNTTATNGTPSFAAEVDFPVGIGQHYVAVGDFNGDGKPDLAVSNQGLNTVSVLLAQ